MSEHLERAIAKYIEWSDVDDPQDIEECRSQAIEVIEAFIGDGPVYREVKGCTDGAADHHRDAYDLRDSCADCGAAMRFMVRVEVSDE